MRKTLILLICFLLVGCARFTIDPAISRYSQVAWKVQLGDSKEKVMEVLGVIQKNLPARYGRQPDKYMEGEDVIEIHYFRTGWVSDGLATDDEFTPYVFKNGILVAIGWVTLGGPKTHGQVIRFR